MKQIGLSFLFFIFLNQSFGQTKFSKWNFNYQYNSEAVVKCQHKVVELKDSLRIYLKLTFDSKYAKANQLHKRFIWNFDYRITSSYDSKTNLIQATFTSGKYQISENEYLFYFEIPKIEETSLYLYVAYFQDEKGEVYIQDIPLRILDKELYSEHLLFEPESQTPIFDKFIHRKDSVLAKSFFDNKLFPIHFFKYNFAPALPPMAKVNTSDIDIKLYPDTTIILKNDSVFSPLRKGGYFIPSIKPTKFYFFLTLDNRYPKLVKTKELIDPTIYIATDDERKAMKNTQKPKVKLDDFWLNIAQDKDFARKLIKSYYSKVQQANLYFTSHKEGWKTDMGMIYIIFGIPDQVYKNDMKETWKFKRKSNVPALNFVFNKRVNPYGEYYFELQNSEEYAEVWFNTVELLRKGIIE